ncbi:MAG TPA: hypothetical protein VF893_06085 [Candidatus Bathyarchaeia archaeon]
MKKTIMIAATLILASMIIIPAFAAAAETGNGAPSGAHYNLNIIGVPKEKKGGTWDNDGHRIFVKLWGVDTKIMLEKGDSFNVIDSDGTDGRATLQLMDPYPGETTTSVYRIFVRALGKPGGSMGMTSGFIDEFGNYWYSLESVNLTRTAGQSKFTDKTLELTTIYVDITDDDVYNPVRYYLFDNALWSYFWDYDNSGLKLLQIRIYVTEA